MMRLSKPWSRPCSARSSIDDSSAIARSLIARIEDSGREFDPTQFPPLSVAKSLEEAKVGDLGMMRSFASSMHHGWHEQALRI